ncbi:MAG TPA: anthrone oxygenase family protein [Steroidobacteraceae bacterium]|jgi:uncharacterized membrane protein|nr:anthrone oxygenase family protein [Steroidobacteraceae bacterium]
MTDTVIRTLTIAAAVGSSLVAGFFFAFSVVTMKALGRIAPAQGIAAMQSINVVVLNPWFFTAFFGTAALCLVLGVHALLTLRMPGAIYVVTAAVLYLAGVIFVTMAFNVPLNNRLAAVAPASPEAERVWTRYLSVWTAWNHLRTVAPLVSAVSFILALVQD